ncbi:MAG TPA: carboxymuconolactone decarboxylase family protein [Thermomicrobiales bacterium]|nr:carboxymuconolactone decarboxylase family protein [Thermomicrobiales bacterium]
MSRIDPVTRSEAPIMLRAIDWYSRRKFGQEMLQTGVIAHNPRFLLPLATMTAFSSGKAEIAPEIRALAMHLVAEINGCAWCIDFGARAALDQGISPAKVAAVGDYASSPLFDDAERAALACAEEMTREGGHVRDATFEELRRHFSDTEIVELVVAIAAENFYNRVNGALGIESQGFCAVPLAASAGARA